LKILWVANFKDVKRPALFMDLAESFAGNPNLQFVMVGRPSRLRRFAVTMARASRIPNLTYLGAQPVERVCELMSEAAIHVNTSSFEGFPNTFIQAWSYGAVVTSVAVDPDQCMERERIGFCAGSMENLHALIVRLAASPEERRETAVRAFEFARTHHSLAEGERFAELIVSTARNNPGGLAKMAPAY
jgi:hypothetical protein